MRNPPPAQQTPAYISGETHYYLGKPYQLQVNQTTRNKVMLERESLCVNVRDAVPDKVKRVLDTWYRKRAKAVFTGRLAVCHPKVVHVGIPYPELKVRMMKSSWSITRGDRVTLNVRLVQMPLESIDLVIFHELCHLAEPNHSKRFYALLGRVLPDWEERRERMRQLTIQ